MGSGHVVQPDHGPDRRAGRHHRPSHHPTRRDLPGSQKCGKDHWRPDSVPQDARVSRDDQERHYCRGVAIHVEYRSRAGMVHATQHGIKRSVTPHHCSPIPSHAPLSEAIMICPSLSAFLEACYCVLSSELNHLNGNGVALIRKRHKVTAAGDG